MRRVASLAVLGVMLYLAVSALPVAAADANLEVASIHTTDSDFNSAQKLENVSVIGTGTDASVSYSGNLIDDFEDGDISEYEGDTSGFNVQQAVAKDGSYALEGTNVTSGHLISSTSGLSSYPSQGSNFSGHIRFTNVSAGTGFILFGTQNETSTPGGYEVRFKPFTDEVELTVRDGNGGTTTLDSTALTHKNNVWYKTEVQWGSDGSIDVTIYNESGSQITTLSGADTSYSSGGIGFRHDHSSASESTFFDYYLDSSGGSSGTYISDSHSASSVAEAWTNLTLENASASVEWQGWDGSQWQTVQTTTYSTSGNRTVDVSSADYDKWRVNVSFSKTGESPVGEIHDEGLLFDAQTPVADNDDATPQNDSKLNDSEVTLSIPINDSDFGTVQGDSLQLDWYVDGSQIHSETISSNTTATHTTSVSLSGSHDWHVEVSDSYGETTTSNTFSFKVPSQLTFRNASNASELVAGANVTVTFYASSEKVIEKSDRDGDGTINMTDVPVDQTMVIQADADGYHNRRIVIKSIYQQENVFLLSQNVSSVEVRFTNEDTTGSFPSDSTTVFVSRPENVSGSNKYRVVAADEFGVNGMTTWLEEDVRYTLKIENEQGDVRVLGSYTPTTSETVGLKPVESSVSLNDTQSYNWKAYYENVSGSERIVWEYKDAANDTTDVTVQIYEQDNKSNAFPNQSIQGPIGTASVTQPLSGDQTNKTWVVEWSGTRGGETVSGKAVVGPNIRDPSEGVPGWVQKGIAIITIILTGALFSKLNAGTGAVTTSLVAGGFWWSGFLPREAGGAILTVLLIAILWKARGGAN